jgi:hypothetical protein
MPVPGNGIGLPDSVTLVSAEITSLRNATDAYNAAIATEASTRGAALVDLAGLLRTASTSGIEIQGSIYTSEFITGGLFSLDGVHPNDLAQAVLCNALIDACNQRFGSGIPHANLGEAMTDRADRALPARIETAGAPLVNDAAAALPAMFPWRGTFGP